METTSQEERSRVADVLDELGPADPLDQPVRPRRRSWWKWLSAAALLAALVAAAAVAVPRLGDMLKARPPSKPTTHTVRRGELVITVTEEGSLESAGNVDIKCEVAGGTTILWIIQDGKEVREGDELVRLDSSKLAEQVGQQRIAYEKARAAHIQAEKDYAAAKIAVQEYEEGTYRKEHQEAESKVAVAQESLRSAQNSLQHAERMFRKGYISPLQLESQKFAVERAQLDLGTARVAKDVLERFTQAKMLQELRSKRDAAEAKWKAEKASLDLEETKLNRLEKQLTKCVMRAPKAGMVVYANERMYYGDQQGEIKEGMTVREEQTILRLPDLSKMRVKVGVHESKVDQLRPGMRARVRVQEREFQGTVISVANRPEAHWFLATAKKYPAMVELDGNPKDLRPGMTAEAEILVSHLKDVLSLPVAAVYEQGGRIFCGIAKGQQIERRNLELGLSNDKFVHVKSGVQAGEEVVLNPRAALGDMGEETPKPPVVDVKKKFGAPPKGMPGKDPDKPKGS